ncbi:putative cytochrome P450 [Helianthus annuus]|uniref:Cytochrome P450 n=2 Tax=Helianthus annuus TaxID=4232 RepID=A0A9K3HQ74_HELAN|nr:putative cytochrome P450 [Helianthus annuus]KAJ0501966.1 putative cytochrome P450 [Helianthus annuus]KAJ0509908.1 putative cytochrome P450 [Helianthus annuus]KAJ0517894.1 putative cytochrome P450 [Helianthus annuus]KAJ0685910.1 putative cytochrome P450 [Helianthus annuus]
MIKTRIAKKELSCFWEKPVFSEPDRTAQIVQFNEYDDEQQVTRFNELLLQCQSMFATFFYRDRFPLVGWLLDVLNGSMARLEKNFKDMDEFYQELIDEHVNRTEPNNKQEDMVDILLKIKQDSDCSFELTYDHIKAVIMNILLGGTETSAATVVWAMTLLMKNPKSLKKVQQEVRNAIGNKGKVHEDDLYKLHYLKQETLRLYPIAPLLVPRESRDRCVLNGFEIPKKTLVYVNAWAVGRDPQCWDRPQVFEPERFMGSSVDYKGTDFELIPFGSGRRVCPGMSLGAATVEVPLSNLVYSFDWEMPGGQVRSIL